LRLDDVEDIRAVPTPFTPACYGHPLAPIAGPIIVRGAAVCPARAPAEMARITHALRHPDIWAAAACHSGDMGFELCYLPDMPAVLRTLAGTENSIEKGWRQLEAAKKHLENSFKVVNALAMAASYDPGPTQFLGIRLPVTFDTCEVIAEHWAN
jgi:hypothetical protein